MILKPNTAISSNKSISNELLLMLYLSLHVKIFLYQNMMNKQLQT